MEHLAESARVHVPPSRQASCYLASVVCVAYMSHTHSTGGSSDHGVPYVVMLKNPGK